MFVPPPPPPLLLLPLNATIAVNSIANLNTPDYHTHVCIAYYYTGKQIRQFIRKYPENMWSVVNTEKKHHIL